MAIEYLHLFRCYEATRLAAKAARYDISKQKRPTNETYVYQKRPTYVARDRCFVYIHTSSAVMKPRASLKRRPGMTYESKRDLQMRPTYIKRDLHISLETEILCQALFVYIHTSSAVMKPRASLQRRPDMTYQSKRDLQMRPTYIKRDLHASVKTDVLCIFTPFPLL